jgi:hypothetical protein
LIRLRDFSFGTTVALTVFQTREDQQQKEQAMPKTKKKTLLPTCCECGGTNVETNAWIAFRDDGSEYVVNSEGPISDESGNWCHDCDENVCIEFPDTTPERDALRQRNEAARENASELLTALKSMIEAVSDSSETWRARAGASYATAQRLVKQIEGGKP